MSEISLKKVPDIVWEGKQCEKMIYSFIHEGEDIWWEFNFARRWYSIQTGFVCSIYRNVSCLSVLPGIQTYLKLPYKQDSFFPRKIYAGKLWMSIWQFFSRRSILVFFLSLSHSSSFQSIGNWRFLDPMWDSTTHKIKKGTKSPLNLDLN